MSDGSLLPAANLHQVKIRARKNVHWRNRRCHPIKKKPGVPGFFDD
jgi:hypothetical protein